MGFFSKIFKKDDPLKTDGRRLYNKLMAQSRQTRFYGEGRFPDTYDGRVDVLTLHIAPVLTVLNTHGIDGEKLNQALFDEMKDDFEVALREEALSDAGVKKRITPMISLFYDRVRSYSKILHDGGDEAAMQVVLRESLPDGDSEFVTGLSEYVLGVQTDLTKLRLGQIALTDFSFPVI